MPGKMWPKIFLIAMLCVGASAHADRDIVYSARYYTPPGSRGTSHWHLYRINPDGTGRTQLTSGNADDLRPRWSPDGREILFVREQPGPNGEFSGSDRQTLCLIGANGGPVKRLRDLRISLGESCRWSPDGRTVAATVWEQGVPSVLLIDITTGKMKRLKGATDLAWSPDAAWMAVVSAQGARLVSTRDGKAVPVEKPLNFPIFLDNRTVVGVVDAQEAADCPLRVVGMDGKEQKRVKVKLPESAADDPADPRQVMGLAPVPGSPGSVVYALNRHNSTTGTLYQFVLVDLATGNAKDLGLGPFLAWSPDGWRFCTTPGRDLGSYGKGRNGAERRVWVAPLQVGSVMGGTQRRAISAGTVWVVDGDWGKLRPGNGVAAGE